MTATVLPDWNRRRDLMPERLRFDPVLRPARIPLPATRLGRVVGVVGTVAVAGAVGLQATHLGDLFARLRCDLRPRSCSAPPVAAPVSAPPSDQAEVFVSRAHPLSALAPVLGPAVRRAATPGTSGPAAGVMAPVAAEHHAGGAQTVTSSSEGAGSAPPAVQHPGAPAPSAAPTSAPSPAAVPTSAPGPAPLPGLVPTPPPLPLPAPLPAPLPLPVPVPVPVLPVPVLSPLPTLLPAPTATPAPPPLPSVSSVLPGTSLH
jgi:hypothetical protein